MDKWTSAVVGFAALVFSGVALAQIKLPDLPPPAMPRGLVSHDSATTPGYVLFSPIPSTTTFLIDNDGQVVHTWDNEFGGSADYLEADGTLLRGFRDPQILHFRQGGVSGGIQEIDWDGKILWQWKLGDEKRVLDFPPCSLMVIATLEEFNDMNSVEVLRCQRSEYEECGSPARSV